MSLSLETFVEGRIYLDTMMFYFFLRADEKTRPIIGSFFVDGAVPVAVFT